MFPVLGVSPASGFAPSAATLLHPALLVAVASLCFFLCCWSACPAGSSSRFAVYAVVCFLSAALPFSSLWSAGLCGCGLRPLWPSHIPWSPALSPVFYSPRRCCWKSPPLLWLFCGGPVWLQLLQLWSPFVWWFSCWWSGPPCVCCPCVLRGVRGFQTRGGSLPACFWPALQVSGPFRSPPSLSLSLLFPDPAPLPSGGCPCRVRCLSLVPSTLELRLLLFLC